MFDVTNPGLWMAHCHIAEHMQSGMMFSFNVAREPGAAHYNHALVHAACACTRRAYWGAYLGIQVETITRPKLASCGGKER